MQRMALLHLQPLAVFLIFFAFLSRATSRNEQRPSLMKFVFNATDFPLEDYYDYVVVGGGTAGCPLAATLSQTHTVLLLERGGVPYDQPDLMSQEGFLTTLEEANAFTSPAQTFVSEEGVPNARGRVLGGSSAINAGFYSRADPDFYRLSGIDWDLSIANQSFNWVERDIVFRPDLRDWQSTVRDALLESGVAPYNGFTLDHKIGTKIGGTTFDSTGRRHISADLLSRAHRDNIRVAVYADVERVLLASSFSAGSALPPAPLSVPSAVGVVYSDAAGRYHHAMVRDGGEVILSAGAIGTPQLLLLSGIGPRPYLASWGIPVAQHHPYVGEFLYDNPRNGISIVPADPLEHSLIQVVGITASGSYVEAASNVIPFASPARHAFIGEPSTPIYLTVATLMEKIAGPDSVGSLRLASTDVRASPNVRFNYFASPVDMERCVAGMRRIGALLKSRSMEDQRFREWFGAGEFRFVGTPLPADQADDFLMADFCRRTVSTIWHYHGGAVVGKVVDRDLRVMGVDSLRVVDGSVFTVSPGTNPQATVMMMGRYFGLKMVRDRRRAKR